MNGKGIGVQSDNQFHKSNYTTNTAVGTTAHMSSQEKSKISELRQKISAATKSN